MNPAGTEVVTGWPPILCFWALLHIEWCKQKHNPRGVISIFLGPPLTLDPILVTIPCCGDGQRKKNVLTFCGFPEVAVPAGVTMEREETYGQNPSEKKRGKRGFVIHKLGHP